MLGKKSRINSIIFLCIFLSVLLIGIAFAATKLISAEDGGTIKIRNGVKLVIPEKSLDNDTMIHAHMSSRNIKENNVKKKRLVFDFQPSGIEFSSPAELHIDKNFFEEENAEDIVICEGDTNDEEGSVNPVVEDNGDEFIILIDHFSYYYYRRR